MRLSIITTELISILAFAQGSEAGWAAAAARAGANAGLHAASAAAGVARSAAAAPGRMAGAIANTIKNLPDPVKSGMTSGSISGSISGSVGIGVGVGISKSKSEDTDQDSDSENEARAARLRREQRSARLREREIMALRDELPGAGEAPEGVSQVDWDRCYIDGLDAHIAVEGPVDDGRNIKIEGLPASCMVLNTVLDGKVDGGATPEPCGSACLKYKDMTEEEYVAFGEILEQVRTE